jgi:hypothetical protein
MGIYCPLVTSNPTPYSPGHNRSKDIVSTNMGFERIKKLRNKTGAASSPTDGVHYFIVNNN